MYELLSKLKKLVLYELNKFIRPQMVGGFKRNDGVILRKTRISNCAFLESKEKLYIEDHVFIGHFTFIDASRGLKIEEGCQITSFVSIATHSSHISMRLYGEHYTSQSEHKAYITGPVTIGKYTFIGSFSLIMPNTTIGKGCLVTPFSYVRGNFPDFSIIGGNPARIIGDTRLQDNEYLDEYPELRNFYEKWAK
jgi:acetyltransferase-like isoleucine patch superfamily enzyme